MIHALRTSSLGLISMAQSHKRSQNLPQWRLLPFQLTRKYVEYIFTAVLIQTTKQLSIRGGTPYMPHGYVPLQREWFLCRFGMKTGMEFAHFGLELGVVFEETTKVYERIYRFNSK